MVNAWTMVLFITGKQPENWILLLTRSMYLTMNLCKYRKITNVTGRVELYRKSKICFKAVNTYCWARFKVTIKLKQLPTSYKEDMSIQRNKWIRKSCQFFLNLSTTLHTDLEGTIEESWCDSQSALPTDWTRCQKLLAQHVKSSITKLDLLLFSFFLGGDSLFYWHGQR